MDYVLHLWGILFILHKEEGCLYTQAAFL
jgi:hypothetical protein